MRAVWVVVFVACAHVGKTPPVHERCRVVAAGSADAMSDPWVRCTDEDVDQLRENLAPKQLTVQRSERVPGTGYRLLCVDPQPARPCVEKEFPQSKPGDIEVLLPWSDLDERRLVVDTAGPPRLDPAWREQTRNRLYSTGRYRDVTVTVAPEERDGLRALHVEIDRYDQPPQSTLCPRRPACANRNCTRRDDGCVVCECTAPGLPDISDSTAQAIKDIVGFISIFLPRR